MIVIHLAIWVNFLPTKQEGSPTHSLNLISESLSQDNDLAGDTV